MLGRRRRQLQRSQTTTRHEQPRVTVVVSTYAGEALIGGCLEMLLGQTIAAEVEIVVVDSGSPEREGEVVTRFQDDHPSIRYVRTERETLYQAWNRALGLASGTYFANVNTDDWLRDDGLELMAAALDEYPACDLAYANWAITDAPRREPAPDDPIAWHPAYEPVIPLVFCFGGCVQFWRTSSLRALEGFDPTYAACGDLDVLCRLSARGGSAVLVPEVLEGFFQNPRGISQRDEVSAREQRSIYARARAEAEIDRLYDTSGGGDRRRADAWTALGNHAMTALIPWQTGPIGDDEWALQCYGRALDLVPSHAAALHNRYVVLRNTGRVEQAERQLRQLPATAAAMARSSHLGLVTPDVEPAVRGPVYEPPPHARRSAHLTRLPGSR